jgi:hypothetical protein
MQHNSSESYSNALKLRAEEAEKGMEWYKSTDREWYKKAGYQLSSLMGGRYKQIFKVFNRQIKDYKNSKAHHDQLQELSVELNGAFEVLAELSKQVKIDGSRFGIQEHSTPSSVDAETPSARDSLLNSSDVCSTSDDYNRQEQREMTKFFQRTDSGVVEDGPSSSTPTPEGNDCRDNMRVNIPKL